MLDSLADIEKIETLLLDSETLVSISRKRGPNKDASRKAMSSMGFKSKERKKSAQCHQHSNPLSPLRWYMWLGQIETHTVEP